MQVSVHEELDGVATSRRAVLESSHTHTEPNEIGRILNASACVVHLQREMSLLVESADLDILLERLSKEDDRATRRVVELIDKGI